VSRYRLAGGAADELIAVLGADPTERNRRLWAFYCYHHDAELILDKAREYAAMEQQGELKNAVTAFQKWLTRSFTEETR